MEFKSRVMAVGGVKRQLFAAYSYLENILRLLLEVLPQPARWLFFKIILGRLGSGSNIDYQVYFRYPWQMHIGRRVWINRGCEFYGSMLSSKVRIDIGDGCALAPGVKVLTATHDYRYLSLPDRSASVTIGPNAWIGAGVIILPGISIGEGAVVGAGSVVSSDVPPFAIVAGNPARFLKIREINDEHPIQ